MRVIFRENVSNKQKITWIFILSLFIFNINLFIQPLNKDYDEIYNRISNNRIPNIQVFTASTDTWWDDSYTSRKQILLSNHHINSLPKGYSVNITLNTYDMISSGKLRNDGNDLRIIWFNPIIKAWNELDRINETNFNSLNTQIWFKTQVPINPGDIDSNYYLYYGNSDAVEPPINKCNVYYYYDSFSQPDGPAYGWTVTQGEGWTVVNNEYRENEDNDDRRTILDKYKVANMTIEVSIKSTGAADDFGAGVIFRYENQNHFYTAGIGLYDRFTALVNHHGVESLLASYGSESSLELDKWYNLEIYALSSEYKIYINDELKIKFQDIDHLNAGNIGFQTSSNLNTFFEDLKIKLLVSTEPVLNLGGEQNWSAIESSGGNRNGGGGSNGKAINESPISWSSLFLISVICLSLFFGIVLIKNYANKKKLISKGSIKPENLKEKGKFDQTKLKDKQKSLERNLNLPEEDIIKVPVNNLKYSLTVICPICKNKKQVKIPKSVVNEAKQLTTLSIPKKLICEHHFQIFIDKNLEIRGYQKVDFEITTEGTEGLEVIEERKKDSL